MIMETTQYRHGQYLMTIHWHKKWAQVMVEDLAQLRFPLLWSMDMNKAQAQAAKTLFEGYGYFQMF